MTTLKVVGKRTHTMRPKRVKLAAVMAAEASGVMMAAKQMGIPHQTISQWLERPEFGEIRRKTREDLAEEYKVAAHVTLARLVELAPTMEARDIIFAAEKATTLLQLLSGAATSRTETRELLDDFDDHETEAMQEWLRSIARERMAAEGMGSAADPS